MKKFIGNFALLVYGCLAFWVVDARASDLHDIRTGYHITYSRVVIQLSQPVRYHLQPNSDKSAATVIIASEVQTWGFERAKIASTDAFLREVEFRRRGRDFEVEIKFKQSNCSVEHRTLNSPFRIILDVYPAPSTSQGTVSAVEKNSQQPAVDTFAGLRDVATVLDSNRVIFSMPDSLPVRITQRAKQSAQQDQGGKAAGRQEEEVARQAAKDAAHQDATANLYATWDGRDPYWLFAGAFLLVDFTLLAWFLVRRRRSRPRTRPLERQQRRVSPNRPELPSPEFLEFLKSAMDEEQISVPEEAQPVAPSVRPQGTSHDGRLDELVGSLAEVLEERQAESVAPVPPEFSEIALDLNLGTGDLSEEEARRQLIGKDGLEFMKNVKKLYLN